MGSLSPVHWLIVIVVLFILFGSSRLPGVVKGFGEGVRAFKKGLSEDPSEAKQTPKQLNEPKPESKPEAKTPNQPS
jgi:sec-independent protein translocase protein TatA